MTATAEKDLLNFGKNVLRKNTSSTTGDKIFAGINKAKQERIKSLTSLRSSEVEKMISKGGVGGGLAKELEKGVGKGGFAKELEKGIGGFKLSSVSTLLVRGLMILIGFLLIVQGIFSVRTYEKRNVKDVKPAVIRSYDAASFFVGVGVGIILHQALHFFEFELVDKIFIYILIFGIALYAGYVTNRMNAISKESDTKKAQNIALTAESFSLGMIGVAVGVVISFTFITIGKFVPGEFIIYVEIAGVIVGGLFVAAACANQFYLYDNTGKNYRTALIISIIIFILAILAIAGAIALLFI